MQLHTIIHFILKVKIFFEQKNTDQMIRVYTGYIKSRFIDEMFPPVKKPGPPPPVPM